MIFNDTDVGVVAGTLIRTNQGYRPIEELKIGDLVLSMYMRGTTDVSANDLTYKPISNIFKSLNTYPVMNPIDRFSFFGTDNLLFCSKFLDYNNTEPNSIHELDWIKSGDLDRNTHSLLFIDYQNKIDYEVPCYYQTNKYPFNCMKNMYLLGTADYQVAIHLGHNFVNDSILEMSPSLIKFQNDKPKWVSINDEDSWLYYYMGSYGSTITNNPDGSIIILDKDKDQDEIKYLEKILEDARDGDIIPFLANVYHLEVEDNHNYFAGNFDSFCLKSA